MFTSLQQVQDALLKTGVLQRQNFPFSLPRAESVWEWIDSVDGCSKVISPVVTAE